MLAKAFGQLFPLHGADGGFHGPFKQLAGTESRLDAVQVEEHQHAGGGNPFVAVKERVVAGERHQVLSRCVVQTVGVGEGLFRGAERRFETVLVAQAVRSAMGFDLLAMDTEVKRRVDALWKKLGL